MSLLQKVSELTHIVFTFELASLRCEYTVLVLILPLLPDSLDIWWGGSLPLVYNPLGASLSKLAASSDVSIRLELLRGSLIDFDDLSIVMKISWSVLVQDASLHVWHVLELLDALWWLLWLVFICDLSLTPIVWFFSDHVAVRDRLIRNHEVSICWAFSRLILVILFYLFGCVQLSIQAWTVPFVIELILSLWWDNTDCLQSRVGSLKRSRILVNTFMGFDVTILELNVIFILIVPVIFRHIRCISLCFSSNGPLTL